MAKLRATGQPTGPVIQVIKGLLRNVRQDLLILFFWLVALVFHLLTLYLATTTTILEHFLFKLDVSSVIDEEKLLKTHNF